LLGGGLVGGGFVLGGVVVGGFDGFDLGGPVFGFLLAPGFGNTLLLRTSSPFFLISSVTRESEGRPGGV